MKNKQIILYLSQVEQKKSQAQMQTSSDTDTLAYLFPLSKDTMEIRQVAKSAGMLAHICHCNTVPLQHPCTLSQCIHKDFAIYQHKA